MTEGARARRIALGLFALLASACGAGAAAPAKTGPRGATNVLVARDRPPLAVIAREGDPRGAVGVAVTTGGIASDRGAEVAVALAGVVEARLAAAGVRDVTVVGGWDGYRVRALVASDADGAAIAEAVRAAMLTPVDADAAAIAAAKKKVAALAHRPLHDAALLESVRCTGDAFATRADASVTASELEAWRKAAHGLGRVAFATAGGDKLAEAVGGAITRGEAWPRAAAVVPSAWPTETRVDVYDATGTAAPGAVRATFAVQTPSAAQAVAAANALGDPRGPLASRLGALDAPARVREVGATAHATGGCVAVVIEMGGRELAGDLSGRVATAVALARQELAVQIAEAPSDPATAREAATRAGDPRDAAERAAWWTLSAPREGALSFAIAIGLASGRDAAPNDALATRAQAIKSDLDRATVAWHAPVVEGRARVERGQGELWVVIASPCGTSAEVDGDAGVSAAFAMAAAEHATRARANADVEPWIAPDGIGLVVHGAPLRGESPAAHARRLADVAARSFAADPIGAVALTPARASLLARAGSRDGRVFAALGGALAPGHPSWLAPLGTTDGVGRASDEAVTLRASAIRSGPLRVAVLANTDAAQASATVDAVDRWVARRPGEVRACAPSTPPTARPGTYAVDVEAGAPSEATFGIALPATDDARRSAQWIAAALDGADGLLARALGDSGLARSWSASVVGAPRTPALVVRVVSSNAQLDAAVAQTRALIDRLRQNGLADSDRARANDVRARADLAASLDPRVRLLAVWRGDRAGAAPTADAIKAFAATLRDDALVIVAARPSRTKGP